MKQRGVYNFASTFVIFPIIRSTCQFILSFNVFLKNHLKLFLGSMWGLKLRAALAATNMKTLYQVPFLVLECPHLKLKKLSLGHDHDSIRSGDTLAVASYLSQEVYFMLLSKLQALAL